MDVTREYAGDSFLLHSKRAEELYNRFAAGQPIVDYHCHLPVRLIAENYRFRNLADLWLAGDHYKWRAMRTAGVPEKYVTGDASDWEKFEKWAAVMPLSIRSPLYQWAHMELRKPFGIRGTLLSPATARDVWDRANSMLQQPEFSCRGLIRQFNVEALCTTDDPADDLRWHRMLRDSGDFPVHVLPTFRPDRILNVKDPAAFRAYVEALSAASGVEIRSFTTLIEALRRRRDFFHETGCRISDQGIDEPYAADYTEAEADAVVRTLLDGHCVDAAQTLLFRSAVLHQLALMYHEVGWAQQFHFGPLRNINSRLFGQLGPDTGFDAMGDFHMGLGLARFLDRLDSTNQLTRTILYNLNPVHNEQIVTIMGAFQDGSIPGKMQFGSAWWFMDQRDGIIRQLEALSNMGLLACFVGMLTDSRSFVSYSRHDYFRRILCDVLGGEMERGLVPDDPELVGNIVSRVSYDNAKEYFRLGA